MPERTYDRSQRQSRVIRHAPLALKRDIFTSSRVARSGGKKVVPLVSKVELTELEGLKLKATVIDKSGSLAIIGDSVVSVGESVKGFKVTAIMSNEVMLSGAGKNHILRMSAEGSTSGITIESTEKTEKDDNEIYSSAVEPEIEVAQRTDELQESVEALDEQADDRVLLIQRREEDIANVTSGITAVKQNQSYGIYTIQLGSFIMAESAQRKYNQVTGLLHEEILKYLRIDKVGKYYAVRLGKYTEYDDAKDYYESFKSDYPDALILKTFITGGQAEPEKIYTMQIASFRGPESSRRQYEAVIRRLNRKGLDYLRIEKIEMYYAIRIGKFRNYDEAKEYFQFFEAYYPDAIIMKTVMEDERLVAMYKHDAVTGQTIPVNVDSKDRLNPDSGDAVRPGSFIEL